MLLQSYDYPSKPLIVVKLPVSMLMVGRFLTLWLTGPTHLEIIDLLITDSAVVRQEWWSDSMEVIELMGQQRHRRCLRSFFTWLVSHKPLSAGTKDWPTNRVELGIRGGLLWVVQFAPGVELLAGVCPRATGILSHLQVSCMRKTAGNLPMILVIAWRERIQILLSGEPRREAPAIWCSKIPLKSTSAGGLGLCAERCILAVMGFVLGARHPTKEAKLATSVAVWEEWRSRWKVQFFPVLWRMLAERLRWSTSDVAKPDVGVLALEAPTSREACANHRGREGQSAGAKGRAQLGTTSVTMGGADHCRGPQLVEQGLRHRHIGENLVEDSGCCCGVAVHGCLGQLQPMKGELSLKLSELEAGWSQQQWILRTPTWCGSSRE